MQQQCMFLATKNRDEYDGGGTVCQQRGTLHPLCHMESHQTHILKPRIWTNQSHACANHKLHSKAIRRGRSVPHGELLARIVNQKWPANGAQAHPSEPHLFSKIRVIRLWERMTSGGRSGVGYCSSGVVPLTSSYVHMSEVLAL